MVVYRRHVPLSRRCVARRALALRLTPRLARHAGGVVSSHRKGYVLHMWTGLFPINANGQPVIFSTLKSTKKALVRYPHWGRPAVTIYEVRTRPGSNGRPDYILGDIADDYMAEIDEVL